MKTRFSNSYLSLPEQFYQRVSPTPVEAPAFVALNEPLAEELGLESSSLRSPEWLAVLAGNRVPEGAQPVALAYSGHQFGHFVPLLGDGRAVLIGELTTPQGLLYDLQLKGSGRTPYSRRGDGRAALGPMLREYIIGEALHHLGIPATRTLAVVASGEVVVRERPLPGGIQSRIAQSHIRIGTFQYASERGDRSALIALADYVIARHYPELVGGEDRYFELARSIFSRQARLVAQWMHVGFIHGVMNTDNVAVSGESIDFGPCAFMNRLDPDTVFSSIDRDGRYAFGMQPTIIQWNLTRLVEALVPIFGTDENTAVARAQELVDGFPALFTEAWYGGMRAKLGLCGDDDGDNELIKQLLEGMYAARVDYTNTFRALSGDAHFSVPAALNDWRVLWDSRIDPTRNGRSREETLRAMRCVNPAVIARNHLVENALKEAVDNQNVSIIHQLVNALRDPYTPQSDYGSPPSDDHDQGYRTFCGT